MFPSFYESWPKSALGEPPGIGELQLWSVRLSELACSTQAWHALLSPDEQAAVARLCLPQDRQRATLGRGWLRAILGHCIGEAPGRLRFEVGLHGKPRLAMQAPAFSVSHSGDLLLVALAGIDMEIGVDVEQHRQIADSAIIAARYFHPHEAQVLEKLATPDRQKAFFDCWTCKESVVKATGLGLAQPLSTFRLRMEDAPGAVRIDWIDASEASEAWFVQTLSPAPGYSAAVAGRGKLLTLPKCRHFSMTETGGY